MKYFIVVPVVAVLFATNVYAKCDAGSKTLFFCSTQKGKQIEVCDAGKTISYSFGKSKTKPEIVVTVPRNQASTSQWSGMGRYMNYSVDIPNGKTTYSVFHAVDKLTEEHGIEAGVNVIINNKNAATVKCVEKGMINNLEGVDLKASE